MPRYDPLISVESRIRPILGSLRSVPVPIHEGGRPGGPLPFITISRQAGAGGWALGARLLHRLRGREPEADPPWTSWDRELVEKVADDHHISRRLVESLEQKSRSWLEELLGGMTAHDVDEYAIYRRVATTVRALAQAGHAILVGRGGVFITRSMPQGIHIRLVAPIQNRVERMMGELSLDHAAAERWVREQDRRRDHFYQKYWPGASIGPESFTLTLNTGLVSDEAAADAVAALVPAWFPAIHG